MGKLFSQSPAEVSPDQLTRLTILHSNDIHGDFLAEDTGGQLTGGISRLSGYVQQVRQQEDNVLYAIAGDFFRGSFLDSEFKGISTIEFLNLLGPDVVTIGNHEADYGLGHLLLLEKCARFPMINANLYVKKTGTRLFPSHTVLHCAGLNILFIGLLDEAILAMARKDALTGGLVDVADPVETVGAICNNYKDDDIDLTVLLTHIGFQEDQALAAKLDPAWGVDLIIGGHSHTLPEQPARVNDILIVQAGHGTDQIGRLELQVDKLHNTIHDFTWQAVPINDKLPRDLELEQLVSQVKAVTDERYARIVTRFAKPLTHPSRTQETELGDLFADLMADALKLDVMFMGSGSIRLPSLGPVLTFGLLNEVYPFDDSCTRVVLTGKTIRQMLAHVLREEAFHGNHTEFFQISRRLRFSWDRQQQQFTSLTFDGKPLEDAALISIGLQKYQVVNFLDSFGLSLDDVAMDDPQVVSTSCFQVLEEQLTRSNHLSAQVDGRMTIF